MTSPPVSRNTFAAPGQLSLADLIARIRAADDLTKTTRQNWCWALVTIGRMAGKQPDAIPAHPEFLRRIIGRAAPLSTGLGLEAWNNAKSLTGKAMAWAGLISVPGHYQAPYTPEWASLWSLLPTKTSLTFQLGRFFHYCSANDIRPEDVNDEVFQKFHAALIGESLIGNPYEAYRGAAKSWNNAVERIPGWPRMTVVVPSKRPPPFSLPWSTFPDSLRAEVETYLAAAAGYDLDYEFSRPQAPATIEKRRKQLLWYASTLVHSGVEAPSLLSLAVLLDPAIVKRGLEYQLQRRKGQSCTALANLTQFLPALARRIGLPTATVDALKRFKRRLHIERHGLADRHLPTLERFNDPAAVDALLTLARKLRRIVKSSPRKGRREAKLLQTAVAIEILLMAPVRVSNLASIRFDRHLLTVSDRPLQVHLRFPAAEVKNRVALEFPLPEETLELIDLYRQEYLALLEKEPSGFLFPGKQAGRSKVAHALSLQIKKTVFKFTGLDMPAHRFRHAAGKIFLDRNPGQYEVVRLFLGHKNIETTIAFYSGAEGPAAARHYAATILNIRGSRQETHDVR